MVVECSIDGQPIVVDSCQTEQTDPKRYCVVPNDGTAPVCSYLPTLCPENTEHVCINVGLGKSGHEGIVDCDSSGIALSYSDYHTIDGESCTLRPCSVEGQMGCIGNLSGPNKPVRCVYGLWSYYGGTSCQCSPTCL